MHVVTELMYCIKLKIIYITDLIYCKNVTQYVILTQTFHFTHDIQKCRLPEDLAYKVTPAFLCGYFLTRPHLIFRLVEYVKGFLLEGWE